MISETSDSVLKHVSVRLVIWSSEARYLIPYHYDTVISKLIDWYNLKKKQKQKRHYVTEGHLIFVCRWLMKYSFSVEETMKCNDTFACERLITGVKIKLSNDIFIFFLPAHVNRLEKSLIFEIYFKSRVSRFFDGCEIKKKSPML